MPAMAFVVSAIGLTALLAHFVWRRHPTYVAWRSPILTVFQIVRTASYIYLVAYNPTSTTLRGSLKLPEGRRALVFLPAMSLLQALCYVTPLRYKAIVFLFSQGFSIKNHVSRCVEDVATVPGQGARYVRIKAAVDAALDAWLPLPSATPWRPRPGAVTADEAGACIVIRCSVQLTLGFLLPVATLFSEELLSRAAFVEWHGLGPGFVPSPATLLLYNVALLPLQAAVGYHALGLANQWFGSYFLKNALVE